MPNIIIQFAYPSDIMGHAIAWFTQGVVCHVDAVLDNGNLLGAQQGPCGGKPSGVWERPADYLGDTKKIVVDLGRPDLYPAWEVFLYSQVGKPYDITAITAFVADRDWSDPAHWFCSELIAASLEYVGFFKHKLAVDDNKITPASLLLLTSAFGDTNYGH